MSAVQGLPDQELVFEMRSRGFEIDDGLIDLREAGCMELERLAELIALGRTREALQALHDIAPAAPRPATLLTILAARAAEAVGKTSS